MTRMRARETGHQRPMMAEIALDPATGGTVCRSEGASGADASARPDPLEAVEVTVPPSSGQG